MGKLQIIFPLVGLVGGWSVDGTDFDADCPLKTNHELPFLTNKRAEKGSKVATKPVKRRELTPDPDLYCEIKCDLFADESADWESA